MNSVIVYCIHCKKPLYDRPGWSARARIWKSGWKYSKTLNGYLCKRCQKRII